MKLHTKLLMGVSLAALAACGGTNGTQWTTEAGAVVDGGEFGNATMNNTMVMTGERQYTVDLANRFSEEVLTTVNFAFNSATLDAAARETLAHQARWIRQFPEVRFTVYGHTDLVGSAGFNRRLGLRRANAVVHFLSTQGISRDRLDALVSKGETQPLIVTQGRERRNRRTVTEVSGFVETHPAVLDGKYAQIVYRDYVQSAAAATNLTGLTGSEFTTDE
ncbi:MAG: OmpA family protein [Pseudomonadota bacterium]